MRAISFTAKQARSAIKGRCLSLKNKRNLCYPVSSDRKGKPVFDPAEVFLVREPFALWREDTAEEAQAKKEARDAIFKSPSIEGLIAWAHLPGHSGVERVNFQADMLGWDVDWKWSTASAMPRKHARLFIRIVRVDESSPSCWKVYFTVVGRG